MSDLDSKEMEKILCSHGPFENSPVHSSGECVGDWRILAFLGRGGSSEIYRSENVVTGMIAALKILSKTDAHARERFKREVRLLAEMRSAAFPKFYGAGEFGGHLYLAEELLEPIELPSRDRDVAGFVLCVASGVKELHGLGFIHRDIKPGNVMRRPSTGESVLIDMGLAKENEETAQTRNETLSVVDGRAVGVGTPGFSAPEQFIGGRISAATDIHALGMLANACFNGKPPIAWAKIIRRSTSSIPEQRYATVAEFMSAIRRRHAARYFLLGVVTLCIVVAIIISFSGRLGHPRPAEVDSGRAVHPRPAVQRVKDNAPHQNDYGRAACPQAAAETTTHHVNAKTESNDLLDLGTTTQEAGIAVTRIILGGKDVTILNDVVLDGNRRIIIEGPGRITASIFGDKDTSIELCKNAVLINLTDKPYPKSRIKYSLRGNAYLNFKNLDWPENGDVDNVNVNDLTEGGRPIVLFRGPDTFEEALRAVSVF